MELKRLGPYELGKALGKGGMGAVYEALDTSTGRRVAVKALSANLAQSEGFRERFEAEIETLKTLRHEGIVRLYGYGEQDGVLFYAMELVDGTSLEEELQRGRRFDWREVTQIAIQLCRALKHAHDHGVIHRDLKPANVLVDQQNRVKLADFGIARLFGNSQLTSAGGVLGTADYMAPEQADGRPITDRCDQYSLGGVMYALLAGRAPFRAKSLPEMLQLQRYAQPEPVRRYAHDAPVELERVIMQLLSKDPADRFPNTLVLARHLEAMHRALTRPVAADFSVADDPEQASGSQTLPAASQKASPAANLDDTEHAPTMAVDELDGEQDKTRQAAETRVAPAKSGGPARFTPVDENAARHEATTSHGSRLAGALQLLALVAVLGGLAAAGFYLTRPKSADALFAEIEAQAESDNPDSLRSVEPQIEEFVRRFPDDPRVEELGEYRELLTLAKLEREFQLMLRRGGKNQESLLPVERNYLQAMDLVSTHPHRAAQLLQAIVTLYGTESSDDDPGTEFILDVDGSESVEERQAVCAKLAARRLAQLQEVIAEQSAVQREDLRRHLESARKLESDDPDRARAMYQAIVDLYQDELWAAQIVEQARERAKGLP